MESAASLPPTMSTPARKCGVSTLSRTRRLKWGGDSWQEGGGPVWITGSYDPALNLSYWGRATPVPITTVILGRRHLYTDSVVALDPERAN